MEILLARPAEPYENLLGEREMNVPSPFVITVEELAAGIEASPFGSVRTFALPHPAKGALHVTVLGAKFGHGAGMCDTCRNIQELKANIQVLSNPPVPIIRETAALGRLV
jgi:hypothetical protein